MSKLPLVEALLKYHDENNIIFSMPGNKCGLAFKRDEFGIELEKRLGSLDITEVDPLDNLHHPEGVIKESQELLAKTYGVKKAFFMVNGSSGGNLAAIFSAFNEGDEVLVERNCHKSIYNGLILRKLKVTYINPVILENGVFLPPNERKIQEALEKSKNPKGIILTNPNYFGISYKLEEIILKLKNKGLKVIVDQAHGAHFGACDELPKGIEKLADYTVVSAHKTLPALTGGAYLLVNDIDSNIDFYVSTFMTTSPSYLIMASLDYARYYLDEFAKNDYERLIEIAEKYKKKINELNKVKIIEDDYLPEGYKLDKSRYLVTLPRGYSGHKLLDYLRAKGIQGEMSIDSLVVLILSPAHLEEDFEKLYDVIKDLNVEELKGCNTLVSYDDIELEKVYEPFEVFNLKSELCKLEDSEGRILKESIVPYPPGIPLICSGERISNKIINRVIELKENGINIIGLSDTDEIKAIIQT